MLFEFYLFIFFIYYLSLIFELIGFSLSERTRYEEVSRLLPAADEAIKLKLASKADKFIVFLYLVREIKKILNDSFNRELTEEQLQNTTALIFTEADKSLVSQQIDL